MNARRTAFIRVWYPGPWALNHSRTSASTRSEIDVFEVPGLRPCRTIPRTMCFSSASGCSADRWMSRSRMARTRGKSVLEVLEEDRFFISRRLSKRDHMNLRRRLRVHDGNCDSSEQTECDKTLFVVREAIVLESESRPFEYSGCINEVEPMLLQVATTFPFIPGKPHGHSVYTPRICVKLGAFALTCIRATVLLGTAQ